MPVLDQIRITSPEQHHLNDDDAEAENLRSENVRLKAAIAAVNGVLWTNDGSVLVSTRN